MGKGDQKSKRGKINAGSYGNKRPRKSSSVKNIPVNVLDEDEKKAPKTKVRKEVGYPVDKSENAEVPKETKAKAADRPKADKVEETKEVKPKAVKSEETKETKPKAEKAEEPKEAEPKEIKAKKTEE